MPHSSIVSYTTALQQKYSTETSLDTSEQRADSPDAKLRTCPFQVENIALSNENNAVSERIRKK